MNNAMNEDTLNLVDFALGFNSGALVGVVVCLLMFYVYTRGKE